MPGLQKNETIPKRRGRPSSPDLKSMRREQILQAATRQFARYGYHCTDLQVLADKIGIGKGTLYRYFPSKEELLVATAARVMTLMRAKIDAAIAAATDPLDSVIAAVNAYLGFFDANPPFVEIIMLERAAFGTRRKPTYFAHRETNAPRWIQLYSRLMDDGRVRRMPVDAIRDVITTAMYGTMFTNYFTERQKPLAIQAAQIVHVIFNGILTDAERTNSRWTLASLTEKGHKP